MDPLFVDSETTLPADELLRGYCTLVYAKSGSYGEAARRLADRAGIAYADIDIHRFPDGESRVRLPENLPIGPEDTRELAERITSLPRRLPTRPAWRRDLRKRLRGYPAAFRINWLRHTVARIYGTGRLLPVNAIIGGKSPSKKNTTKNLSAAFFWPIVVSPTFLKISMADG